MLPLSKISFSRQLSFYCLIILVSLSVLAGINLAPNLLKLHASKPLLWGLNLACLIPLITALGAIYLSGQQGRKEIMALCQLTTDVNQGDFQGKYPAAHSLELKELSCSLQEMADKVRQLTAFPGNNPQPVLSAEADGRIIFQNPATANYLAELKLKNIEEFLPSSHRQLISICIATNEPFRRIEHWINDRVFSWNYHYLQEQGAIHIYGDDITDQKQLEDQLSHDAFHDPLTGIANRLLLFDRIDQSIKRYLNNPADSFAVILLDIDQFKLINDSLGPHAGDQLLIEISRRLKQIVHRSDTVARLGSDEFGILLEEISDIRHAIHIADRIKSAFERPFVMNNHRLNIACSMGINMGGSETDNSDEILRNADTAMYRAKARGGNCHEIFDKSMHQDAMSRLELEIDLKQALKNNEFIVYYQPILSLPSGSITGFEALVRWQHPERGLVPPGMFIPLTEESGLIIPLGKIIMDQACQQLKSWQRSIPGCEQLMISINLAPRQLSSSSILADIDQALIANSLDPKYVKLEITENGIMENIEENQSLLAELKERQLSLGIDDFGTGYSSLSYLHRFPFDTLKIDRSFVMQMDQGDENKEIVRTIISLAMTLGKKVIAEGIETEEHLDVLRDLQCGYGQGYLFSKPIPADQAEKLLHQHPAGIESWQANQGPASL